MTMRERFERFDAKNPEVYEHLLDVSRRWRNMGGRQWSIWSAFAVVRWERQVAGLPDPSEIYKLNNNYTGYYARKLMGENVDLVGLFETRRMKDETA